MTTTPEPDPQAPPPLATPVAVEERRLHPWSWLFVLLAQLRQAVFPIVALAIFGRGDWHILIVGLVGIVLLVLVSVWRYFTYRYRIDVDSLYVRSGLVERELRQIPFARIHNVSLQRSLLHRMFDVAEVKLESAGGTRPEAHMRVLKLSDALALEALIRRRAGKPVAAAADGDAGEAPATDTATTDATPPRTLLSLSTAEIVRLGLISNRGMIVVGAASALAWQVLPDNAFRQAFDFVRREAADYIGHFSAGATATALTAVAFLSLLVALVRMLSVLLAIVKYHGFVLTAQDRRLTVERGLLTRVRASVPRRRIQAWTLREGLLHRLLRRRSLDIDIATSQADPDQEKSLQELAPVATPAACDALVAELLPDAGWPVRDWQPLHRLAWLRLLVSAAVPTLVLAGAATFAFGPRGLLVLLWLPWSAYAARRHAERAGYRIDARLVAVREGWWSRHWRFTEVDKVQALQLQRTPLDRLTGMASLWFDTAGAGITATPLRIRFLPLDEAERLLAQVQREVARRPLRW